MDGRTDGLRRATDAEILAERRGNPTDLWRQQCLDLAPEVVGRAACRLWGAPDADGVEGNLVWRLWSERCHVLVCIVLGPLRPAVLFGGGNLPDDDGAERLRDEIRQMLLTVDGSGRGE